jgi:hypothetical protein
MKKILILVGSLLVVAGVFTSSSIAHGGNHGQGGHRGHHSARHAQIFSATLTPPTAAVSSARHAKGATGATGPVGKVLYAQNSKKYALGVRLYRLTPATKYNVTIVKKAEPTAVTSHHPWNPTDATGPTATPVTLPTLAAITTDANGYGKGSSTGLRSSAGLDKHAAYYVTVTNEAGDVVLIGDLLTKGHKHHKGNCNLKKETGTSTRAKHHH